jgi:hypothetical protein
MATVSLLNRVFGGPCREASWVVGQNGWPTGYAKRADGTPDPKVFDPHWSAGSTLFAERVVLERLSIQPDLVQTLEASPVVAPAIAPRTNFSDIDALIDDPPEPSRAAKPSASSAGPTARHIDFVQRDAENRRLGRLGEEWTLEFEQRRLHDVERRPDLAKKIEWVADTRGDGLGYDIASFNTDARLYTLAGALSATCRLDPTRFRARAGRP